MSTSMKRDEAWHTAYSERSTRWSTKPEQSQAKGLDNVEFVELGMGTITIAKPPTRPAKPRDLFGQRVPALLESDVLPSILAALRVHPKVAVACRMNSGAMKVDNRYVQFGFPGCPDLWAMLKGGQTLWVEVKRVGKKPTDEQAAFMETVRRNGGKAFTAYDVHDVFRELAA